jgi:hypothetical protein
MEKLWKVISWIIIGIVLGGGILIYLNISNPYLFNGRSQEQIEKEWNQPVTPTVCYSDCN